MGHYGHLSKASFAAAIFEALLGFYAAAPEAFGFGHIPRQLLPHESLFRGLMIFESFALAAFLWLVYRDEKAIGYSRSIGLSALVAAVMLSIENLPLGYRTVRGIIFWATNGSPFRENHPVRFLWYMFVLAMPTLAALSIVVFLFFVYRASLLESGQLEQYHRNIGLKFASLVVFSASIGAMGALIYAVADQVNPTWNFVVQGVLRGASICSLGVFFLFVGLSEIRKVHTES